MERQPKKAIVLGATGLVGNCLTRRILEDEQYGEVLVFTRRPTGISHSKLKEIRADLLSLYAQKPVFKADVVFCCVGTTRAKTPDKERYRKVDYGIPVTAARLCRENGIPAYQVISSLGASEKSPFFYNRLKGEMEAEVLEYALEETHILQPSLIGGNREAVRKGERFAQGLMRFLDPLLLGPLAKYRMIQPEDIAQAMHHLADHPRKDPRVPSDLIRSIAREAWGKNPNKSTIA